MNRYFKRIIGFFVLAIVLLSLSVVSSIIVAESLAAPTVTTTKNMGSGILVEWDAVDGATGYVVYRRAMKSGETSWTTFARWNNTTSLSFLDTKVYVGTKYQYGIKAYYGNDSTTTTNLGPVGPMSTALIYGKKPAAPTRTSTRNTNSGIEVSWDAVKGATGYVIYRRAWSSTLNGWTDFQRWNNTTSTTWTDTTVYAGSRYQYGIKAYYGNDPRNMSYIGNVGPMSTNMRITTRTIESLWLCKGCYAIMDWDESGLFTGYQVQYACDYAFSDPTTFTIGNPATTSKGFDLPYCETYYYFRVRSYHKLNGMTYYGAWSVVDYIRTEHDGYDLLDYQGATCYRQGYDHYYCSQCGRDFYEYWGPYSHEYYNHVCRYCGAQEHAWVWYPGSDYYYDVYDSRGEILTSCYIEETDLVLDHYTNNGIYYVFSLSGLATYNSKGDNVRTSHKFYWRLYDSEGYVIKSGTISSPSVSVGERFKIQLAVYYLQPGEYYTFSLENEYY